MNEASAIQGTAPATAINKPEPIARINQDIFTLLVTLVPRYRPLDQAIHHWREAMARFADGQHFDALSYFFLAIEELFAAGHSGKKQVLAKLKADATQKVGIKAKQKSAGWDDRYLLALLRS